MTKSIAKSIKVIVGATASGKSAFALSLAKEYDAVIINADSQQVYADLRILTARPIVEEEAQVPHKLYGFLGADESCSAGKWLRYAKMEIDWALSVGKTPIIVGGTGLYIKALTQGIAEIPAVEASVRAQASSDYEEMGKEAFCERLQAVDPQFFERLKVYDRQRLIRAYEVWMGTGKPLSHWQVQQVNPPYSHDAIEIIKIELPREELYKRCNQRVVRMVEQGVVEEVRGVCHNRDDSPITKIIGVREFSAYLKGEILLPQAVELCQIATRQYAKRQMTWFRHQL